MQCVSLFLSNDHEEELDHKKKITSRITTLNVLEHNLMSAFISEI